MAAVAIEKPAVEVTKAAEIQEPWSGGDLFILAAWAAIALYGALVFLAVLFGGVFASLAAAAR